MSSISSFSGTTGSATNFSVSALNQTTMTDLKTYLCPKCNNTYDLNLRSNTYVGRVPLILNCNHTMCEECIRISYNKRQVLCGQCHQPSSIVENEKRKIQEVFPVNFFLMGLIYYSKPNMSEISKLSLRPAGVNYKNKNTKQTLGSNSSLFSEPTDMWSKVETQNFIQEKCSQTGCNKSAVLRCADCVEVYCQLCCQTLHKAARGLQTHKVTALSVDFGLEITEKCLQHKENILEFQCSTCDTMVCAYCVINKHQTHNITQLTCLKDTDRPHFETLIKSAEEKLKRLLFAHKKISLELQQVQNSNQASSLEQSVANYFANLHGRLQILEKKLRKDAKNAKNSNSIKLNELSNELLCNIRTLHRLITTVKNIDDVNSNSAKFNVTTLAERLKTALELPSYLIGQQQSVENIGFVCGNILDKLEENFAINLETNSDDYQLVTEDDLPEGYDITLPNELSSIDISDCFTPTKLESSPLLSPAILKSPTDLSAADLLTNALQPKPFETALGACAVEDWVQNVTEETGTSTNIPVVKTADRLYVTVTHIDNPECFYVQLNNCKNKLANLSKEINQHIRSFASGLKSAELNTLYIVKYETKDARPEWYRGRVIDIILNKNEEKVYNVLFIDYGNTQVVSINMLRKISSTLAKPKPFALQCKLFNVYPHQEDWNSNAVKLMAQILTGAIRPKAEMATSMKPTLRLDILMVVMNTAESILEVDLITINGGHVYSTREALIFVGCAVPCLNTSTPINYLKMKNDKPMPKLHTRTETFKTEQALEVILCHVIDPHNIYVQIAENLHHIEHLSDVMTDYYHKPGKGLVYGTTKGENIYLPKKDMIVAVRCNNIGSAWYRGVVKNTIVGQGMVEVFLADFGKTEIISYTDIRKLSERFRNLECQAILMKMADIAPKNGEKVWNNNATEFLMKYVANKSRLRLVVVDPTDTPTVVLFECYASMDLCINAILVEKQFAISTGKISENVEWIKDSNQKVSQEPSYVHDLMNTIQCSKKTYVEDSDSDQENANKIRKRVRVLLTKSPDTIYVACEDNKLKNEQHKLHRLLQDYYSTHHGQTKNWQVGDLCVVRMQSNSQYFRAVVLEKIDDINFKVILRDIAEEIMVSRGNMYIVENQFKKFREGTFRCHLTGVVPAGDISKWSGLAIEFLQDVFTKNTDIYMTKDGPVDKNRKSFPVIMWYSEIKPGEALEPSKLIDHNINKLLIKKGLALRERHKPIIESDLDTKGGDTSSDTLLNTSLPTSIEMDMKNEEITSEDLNSCEKPKIATNMDRNLKENKTPKSKIYSKIRPRKIKEVNVKEEASHGISSEGEWVSASSSEDELQISTESKTKKRRKSAGSIEAEKSYPDLTRLSASASTSPYHQPKDFIVSVVNTDTKATGSELSPLNTVDWNEIIAEDESPKKKEVTPPPVIISSNSETNDWLPPVPLGKNAFFAYATFVDENACIYFHEDKLDKVLKAIEENMKTVFDIIPPEPSGSIWVPGQLCTVKYFVNESWYRGKIISVTEGVIRVHMIDYGNEEECKHEDLRFKVMYLDVPAFANKVSLHNVFPKKGSKWITSDLDNLHAKIVENKIHITLKGKVQPEVTTPAIVKLDRVSINHFMIENSANLVSNSNLKQSEYSEPESDDVIIEEEDSDIVEEHSPIISIDKPCTPAVPSGPVIIRQLSLPRAKYCHNPLPKTLENQKLSISVVSMLDYNKFIFEIITDQNIIETKEQFQRISQDISAVGHKQPQLNDLEVGQACVTQYSEDSEWYRGEVINFDDDNATVGIWFVDYGNFETVPKDTVRAILPEWLMLPVLQYIGEIDGIEVAEESYLNNVFENMAQYCGTSKLAEILSTEPLRVRLYNEDNELAYQDLIDQKMLILKNQCVLIIK